MRDYTLKNMDCLDGLKELPGESVDLVVTSPPYDNIRTYNGYCFDFENIAAELFRTLKVGGGGSLDSFRPDNKRF